jgi:hypothetical protein
LSHASGFGCWGGRDAGLRGEWTLGYGTWTGIGCWFLPSDAPDPADRQKDVDMICARREHAEMLEIVARGQKEDTGL